VGSSWHVKRCLLIGIKFVKTPGISHETILRRVTAEMLQGGGGAKKREIFQSVWAENPKPKGGGWPYDDSWGKIDLRGGLGGVRIEKRRSKAFYDKTGVSNARSGLGMSAKRAGFYLKGGKG